MSQLIKVKTIAQRHIDQLPYEHYWDGEFDFSAVDILGRNGGFLVVQEKSGKLRKICSVAFLDWQYEQLGLRKRVNGKWEYTAPPPHTEYARKAHAAYDAIPMLFIEPI